MLATVIPARRMPLVLSTLSYLAPEEMAKAIQVGQIVEIPFRTKQEYGVIQNLSERISVNEKLKKISAIVGDEPALSQAQLLFLAEAAELYHASLGYLLKMNLPPLQKRKLAGLNLKNHPLNKRLKIQTRPTAHIYSSLEEKAERVTKLIPESGQVLVLVPELSDIERMEKILKKFRPLVITGELSNKELFKKWQEIHSGAKRVVVGTKRAIFLPWFDLKLIIIDDEANPSHKSWDMAPRLHARDAAILLSKHHNASLHLLSHTPAVETFYFAKEKIYASTPDSRLLKKLSPLPFLADMRAERRAGNYSFISEELARAMKKSTGDTFLFLNRRGTFGYVGCRDCGHVFKCPHCRVALNYHQDSGLLKCHFCAHAEKMAAVCPRCQSVTLAMLGVGTQLAENAVRKFIGGNSTRQVIRVDSDADNLDELRQKGQKIIIGTQLAWPYIDWGKTKLLAFLDADSSLYIPEFRVSETMWQLLRDAQYRLTADAEFIIQTSHPEHLVFTSLVDPNKFYEQELQERALLNYPPFAYLVKLIFGHPQQEAAEAEANKLREQLARLTNADSCIKISPPLEATPVRYASRYWQIILIKIIRGDYMEPLKRMLAIVPAQWKVDPNPNTILSIT